MGNKYAYDTDILSKNLDVIRNNGFLYQYIHEWIDINFIYYIIID